jgi:hypothetical protein
VIPLLKVLKKQKLLEERRLKVFQNLDKPKRIVKKQDKLANISNIDFYKTLSQIF